MQCFVYDESFPEKEKGCDLTDVGNYLYLKPEDVKLGEYNEENGLFMAE